MWELLQTSLGEVVLLAGSWSTVTGGLWKFAERAERVASAEGKARVRRWVAGVDLGRSGESLGKAFAHAFDAVFTEKHWSRRCFLRSVASSYAFAIALVLGWLALTQNVFSWSLAGDALVFLGLMNVLNVVPDYASLLKSRWIIGMLTTVANRQLTIALLALDTLLSFLIGLAGMAVVWAAILLVVQLSAGFMFDAVLGATLDAFVTAFRSYLSDTRSLLNLEHHPDVTIPQGLWVYVTLMTSVWVWLFSMSGLIVRTGRRLNVGARYLRSWFDVDQQPFLALAAMSIVIVTLCYVPALLFVLVT